MPIDRSHLKTAIGAMLDALAIEHPIKHQDAYARRYILEAKSGNKLELMYEQSDKTPANIWVLAHHATFPAAPKVKQRQSPATSLYASKGKTGMLLYGRHSALENMPSLGKADLTCLQPETIAEAGTILDHLLEL